MTTKTLLFAGLQDHFQTSQLELELHDSATVTDLLQTLRTLKPQVAPLLDYCVVAVNEQHAHAGQALMPGDVAAVLPPMSGG